MQPACTAQRGRPRADDCRQPLALRQSEVVRRRCAHPFGARADGRTDGSEEPRNPAVSTRNAGASPRLQIPRGATRSSVAAWCGRLVCSRRGRMGLACAAGAASQLSSTFCAADCCVVVDAGWRAGLAAGRLWAAACLLRAVAKTRWPDYLGRDESCHTGYSIFSDGNEQEGLLQVQYGYFLWKPCHL